MNIINTAQIHQYIYKSANRYKHLFIPFGIYIVITYPVYYLIWYFQDSTSYNSFTFRAIATFLGIGLLTIHYWPKKANNLKELANEILNTKDIDDTKPYLEDLNFIFNSNKQCLTQANQVMNALLKNIKYDGLREEYVEIFSVKLCLELSLDKFLFVHGNRSLININPQGDFKIKGNETLVTHIFFNLLKNALYFITKQGKGEIYITFDKSKKFNILYFRDTAQGISSKEIPHIFKHFYTKDTNHGTGIGLAFCKQVMKDLGGDIECVSVLGEYTEFKLSFPKVEECE